MQIILNLSDAVTAALVNRAMKEGTTVDALVENLVTMLELPIDLDEYRSKFIVEIQALEPEKQFTLDNLLSGQHVSPSHRKSLGRLLSRLVAENRVAASFVHKTAQNKSVYVRV